jgi:hypothetical protein
VGGQKGLAVVAVCPRPNKGVLFIFLNSGNFLTLTVLELFKFCGGGWMVVRRTREREKERQREKQLERSFGIHTGHNTAGNIRSLVANHVTELKNSYF